MNVLTGRDREAVRAIIDSIGAPITIGDLRPDGRIQVFVVNRPAEAFYGVPAQRIEGKCLDELDLKPAGRADVIRRRYRKCIDAGESMQFRDFAPVDTAHGRRWVHTTMTPLVDRDQQVTRVMATLVDVTELKLTEEQLADQLARALGGFIPICAACKKIRDRNDEWQPVERYVSRTASARFNHGMCPTCEREWYGSPAGD